MTIDKYGLGSWWPRPDQAAAGALDHLPSDQWPELAARWINAGYDSPLLHQLADLRMELQARDSPGEEGLRSHAAPVSIAAGGWYGNRPMPTRLAALLRARDLMPDALRSIGFDPAPADDAFLARCRSALEVVQRDLDSTGYGEYRMQASLGGWPATVFPAMPDGSYWGGGEAMSRDMDGARLLVMAAYSVSNTLKEVPEVEWPVCVVHGGHPGSIWGGEDAAELIDDVAWWQCTNTGHPFAPVGQLTPLVARTL